jgi:hypothetical protein
MMVVLLWFIGTLSIQKFLLSLFFFPFVRTLGIQLFHLLPFFDRQVGQMPDEVDQLP